MKLSRSNWLLVALSAALSMFALWSFGMTLLPAPAPLLTETGTVSSAEARFDRDRVSVIRFTVAPSGQEFSYPDILPNAQTVWDKIDRDLPVEVAYTRSPELELWGLRVSGETLLTPESAYGARRKNGYWALGVGFAFLLSCMYILFVEGRRTLPN